MYRYRWTQQGQSSERDIRIENAEDVPDGSRQSERAEQDTFESVNEVTWRADGKFEERMWAEGPGQRVECEWEPALLLYRLPLAEGVKWSHDGSCSIAYGAETQTNRRTGEFAVVGWEEMTLGDREVGVWVIEGRITGSSENGGFSSSFETHRIERFAPAYGLMVKRTEESTGTDGSGQTHETTETMELQSLTPS